MEKERSGSRAIPMGWRDVRSALPVIGESTSRGMK